MGVAPGGWLGRWLWLDVGWRLAVGALVGVAVGWLLGRLLFSDFAERRRLTEHTQGFAALAATFLAYGTAELTEGYGFVAVFVCAVTLRGVERAHEYHLVLHSFVEQIERLITVVVLVLLGGAAARGLLSNVGWREVAVAAAVLLVVRPLAGWVGLAGGRTGPTERAVIAFFGVRGVGSLFYVAYALQEGDFADAERLSASGSGSPTRGRAGRWRGRGDRSVTGRRLSRRAAAARCRTRSRRTVVRSPASPRPGPGRRTPRGASPRPSPSRWSPPRTRRMRLRRTRR